MRDWRAATNGIIGDRRLRWAVGVVCAAVVIAAGFVAGPWASLAWLLAIGVAAFSLSLPRKSPEGMFIGAVLVARAILSETHLEEPVYVWVASAIGGVILAALAWPWLPKIRVLPRLGSSWIGLAFWFLGALGAFASLYLKVGIERVVYGIFYGAFALVVVRVARRRDGRDVTIGMVAMFGVGLAVLLATGAANLFQTYHFAPTLFGYMLHDRFWGGHAGVMQPNSIALLAILLGARVVPDASFKLSQRITALIVAGGFLYLENSRTSTLAAEAAAVGCVWWAYVRRREGSGSWLRVSLPRAGGAALCGLALLAAVVYGERGFLFQQRYTPSTSAETTVQAGPQGDVLSGRTSTWRLALDDFKNSGVVEKALGDPTTTRGVISRGHNSLLTTDNAALNELRRGGVLALIASIVGFIVMAWRALSRRAPLWYTVIAVIAALSLMTTDWITEGFLWVMVFAGEATVAFEHLGGRLADGAARSPVPASADAAAQEVRR